jgi:hypothetical protein
MPGDAAAAPVPQESTDNAPEPKPSSPADRPIDAALRATSVQAHVDSMGSYDSEVFAKWDLPAEEVAKRSTEDLLIYFTGRVPVQIVFSFYEDRAIGVSRVKNSMRVVKTAVSRDDFVDAVVSLYRKATPLLDQPAAAAAVFRTEWASGASGPLQSLDAMLIHPDLIEKTKGREKEIIALLAERDAKVKALCERMGDATPYAGAFRMASMQTAMTLAARLNSARLAAWHSEHKPRSDGVEDAHRYIEAFYRFALTEL